MMTDNKPRETIRAVIAAIKNVYPEADEVLVTFRLGDEVITIADVRCVLCAIDDCYSNVIRNGATHAEQDITLDQFKDFLRRAIENMDKDEFFAELLKQFESKVKN